MQGFSNHLQQDLNTSVLRPEGWEDMWAAGGLLYSSPKSKWAVIKDDVIAIEIYPAWPVQDDEPYINLYVPPDWKKRSQFIAKIKAPQGFQHVSRSPEESVEETSIFKYLPYTNYVDAEGLFDSTAFIEAFREATKTLVAMEKSIDGILEDIA